MKGIIIAYLSMMAMVILLGFLVKKEQKETKYPYLKRYLKACGVAVVIIVLACIFLWEWDRLINLIWIILAVMAFYVTYLFRKMDGRW